MANVIIGVIIGIVTAVVGFVIVDSVIAAQNWNKKISINEYFLFPKALCPQPLQHTLSQSDCFQQSQWLRTCPVKAET